MTCQELTTFIKKVFENKDIFDDTDRWQVAQKLMEEIDELAYEFAPYHIGLRLELSRELELKYVGDFYDGWAVAQKGIESLYINKEGEFLKDEEGNIIKFLSRYADRFSDGVAAIIDRGRLFFVKTDGTFIPGDFMFDIDKPEMHRFSCGIGRVFLPDNLSYPRFINKDGQIITDLSKTLDIGCFSKDGWARFHHFSTTSTAQHNSYGFLGPDGNMLTIDDSPYFEGATDFSEGFAWVLVRQGDDNYWRIIDSGGHYQTNDLGAIVQLSGLENVAPSPFHNGWSRFTNRNGTGQYKFFDVSGESFKDEFGTVIFESATDFDCGLAVVKKFSSDKFKIVGRGGKYLRDENGKIIELDLVSKTNGEIEGYKDGLLRCVPDVVDGRWQYLDRRGRVVEFGGAK